MKKVIVISLLISLVAFSYRFLKIEIFDGPLWADQTKAYVTGNYTGLDNFVTHNATGGPIGGTIILGSAFLNYFGIEYFVSVKILLIFITTIFTVISCILCYKISGERNYWWVSLLAILTLNRTNIDTTPPSIIVSYISVLTLFLLLFIIKNKREESHIWMASLGLLVGASVSTRIDNGAILAVMVFSFLVYYFGWRKLKYFLPYAILSFFLLDPFMWSSPIGHIKEIIVRVVYHYGDFRSSKIMPWEWVNASYFIAVSMLVSLCLFFSKQNKGFWIPKSLVLILSLGAIATYGIVLTSAYQVIRYIQPMVFIWEAILPFTLFSLLETAQSSYSIQSDSSVLIKNSGIAVSFIIVLAYSSLALFALHVFG